MYNYICTITIKIEQLLLQVHSVCIKFNNKYTQTITRSGKINQLQRINIILYKNLIKTNIQIAQFLLRKTIPGDEIFTPRTKRVGQKN